MPTRRMITLRDESWMFQYRVAAIALRDDRVLLCRDNVTGYWYMPGGRVELAESSETALVREISEELTTAVQIERLGAYSTLFITTRAMVAFSFASIVMRV